MKKSSLFISIVLSTFVLAILAGVISAYRSFSNSTAGASPSSAPTAQVASISTDAISPQQAAQIAAQLMGSTDLYSVESTTLNGASAYQVTFSSGNVVYISPDGQVLMVAIAPTPAVSMQNNGQTSQPAGIPIFQGEYVDHEEDDD